MNVGLLGPPLVLLLALALNGCGSLIPNEIRIGQPNPLHTAAMRGDVQEVRNWIASGRGLNATYDDYTVVLTYSETAGARVRNRTALIFAALYGHFEVAKLLVDAGADIYVIERRADGIERGNAFERALSEGHVDIAKYIWDKADKTRLAQRLRWYHFVEACEKSCTSTFGSSAKDNLALSLASHLSQAELGLGIGGLPCGRDSHRSALPPLQFLLQSGIVFPGNTLDCIAEYGRGIKDGMAVAKLYLDQGADPDYVYNPFGEPFGASALMLAAKSQNPDLVALLLARGASPNRTNRYKETPLMYATARACFVESNLPRDRQQQLRIVELLLSAGADIGLRDSWGGTVATKGIVPTCCSRPNPNNETVTLCRLIRGKQSDDGYANYLDEQRWWAGRDIRMHPDYGRFQSSSMPNGNTEYRISRVLMHGRKPCISVYEIDFTYKVVSTSFIGTDKECAISF